MPAWIALEELALRVDLALDIQDLRTRGVGCLLLPVLRRRAVRRGCRSSSFARGSSAWRNHCRCSLSGMHLVVTHSHICRARCGVPWMRLLVLASRRSGKTALVGVRNGTTHHRAERNVPVVGLLGVMG